MAPITSGVWGVRTLLGAHVNGDVFGIGLEPGELEQLERLDTPNTC